MSGILQNIHLEAYHIKVMWWCCWSS